MANSAAPVASRRTMVAGRATALTTLVSSTPDMPDASIERPGAKRAHAACGGDPPAVNAGGARVIARHVLGVFPMHLRFPARQVAWRRCVAPGPADRALRLELLNHGGLGDVIGLWSPPTLAENLSP